MFNCEHDGQIFKDEAGLSFHHHISLLEPKVSRSVLMHKGNESKSVIEFAHQKLRTGEVKVDSRNTTPVMVRRGFLDASPV
jgi:hypothetical protein